MTIVVPDATNAVAVTLTAGTMSASAISDAGDTNSSLTAVDLNGQATLSHSSITLADGDAYGITDYGATSGVATVADTTIDASGSNAIGVEGGDSSVLNRRSPTRSRRERRTRRLPSRAWRLARVAAWLDEEARARSRSSRSPTAVREFGIGPRGR